MEARQYAVLGPMEPGSETRAFLGCEVVAGTPRPDLPVVVVWLPPELTSDTQRIARLQRETVFVRRLEHPHIIKVHGLERFDEGWARVVAYADAEPLDDILRQNAGRKLSASLVARVILDACSAVHYAHEAGRLQDGAHPIVHGGLRPDTLLVTFSGRTLVTGYGASVLAPPVPQGAVTARSAYLAPEQIIGGLSSASPMTDVYALGAVLYELLTGRPPFSEKEDLDRAVLSSDVPRIEGEGIEARLGEVAIKALEKRGADRYPSVERLAEGIQVAMAAGEEAVAGHEEVADFVTHVLVGNSLHRTARAALLESAGEPATIQMLSRPAGADALGQGLPQDGATDPEGSVSPSSARAPSYPAIHEALDHDTIVETPTEFESETSGTAMPPANALMRGAGLATEPDRPEGAGSAPLNPASFVGVSPLAGYEDYDPDVVPAARALEAPPMPDVASIPPTPVGPLVSTPGAPAFHPGATVATQSGPGPGPAQVSYAPMHPAGSISYAPPAPVPHPGAGGPFPAGYPVALAPGGAAYPAGALAYPVGIHPGTGTSVHPSDPGHSIPPQAAPGGPLATPAGLALHVPGAPRAVSSGHLPGRSGAQDLLQEPVTQGARAQSREVSAITAFHRRTGDGSRSIIMLVGAAAVALLVFLFAFPKEPPKGLDQPAERSRLPPELVRAALQNKGTDEPSGEAELPRSASAMEGERASASPSPSEPAEAPSPRAAVVAEPGRISLSSIPEVSVFDGVRELGRTPLTAKLDPGLRRLRFTDRKTGINFYRTYRIRPGQSRRDHIELGTGTLVVHAPDGASVALNARRLGKAPLEPVTVYEGDYLLRVTYDGLRWAERFKAEPGQKVEYTVTLRK